MKRKTSYALYTIGLGLLLYFIISLDFQLSTLFLIKKPLYIPVSIAFFILFFTTCAIRMSYFIKSLDNKSHNIITLTKIEFISKYIYYITPSKLYLPAKAILLNKLCKIRKSTGLAIISLEYAIDTVITTAIALCGTLYLFKDTLNISPSILIFLLTAIITLSFIYISIPRKIIETLSAKANRIDNKSIKKYTTFTINIVKMTQNTWREIIFNKKMRYILPITIIQITIAAISTKLLFLSMATNVPILWIITVSASAVFVSGISQIPGGIGIREGTAIILYSTVGVPKEISLIVVLLSRVYTVIPLILGYWYSTNIK